MKFQTVSEKTAKNFRGYFILLHPVGDMQFAFIKGKGTTDTSLIVRQMNEKFTAKERSSILALQIWKKLLIGFQEKC